MLPVLSWKGPYHKINQGFWAESQQQKQHQHPPLPTETGSGNFYTIVNAIHSIFWILLWVLLIPPTLRQESLLLTWLCNNNILGAHMFYTVTSVLQLRYLVVRDCRKWILIEGSTQGTSQWGRLPSSVLIHIQYSWHTLADDGL